MIEANELRIGIYAHYGNEDEIFECIGIDYIKTSNWIGGGFGHTFYNEDLFGIPITEKWLVDLNFKKWDTPRGITYSNKKLILHKRKRGWVINKRFKEPLFIHEIQNIAHALYKLDLKK